MTARRFAWALFAGALAARLAFLALWWGLGLEARFPPDHYASIARSWLGWIPPYVTITHPPVFPALLAAAFWLGAERAVPALLCGLSATLPVALWAWARRRVGEGAARLAGAWLALDPAVVFFAPQLQTETLFLSLLLAFYLALDRAEEAPSDARAALAGLAGAAAALTRGVFAFYGPFFVAVMAARRRWRFLAVCLAVWGSFHAAWAARNWAVYGRFIPVSVQSGWNMYEGFTTDLEELKVRPLRMGEEARRLGLKDPLEMDDHFGREIKAWIRAHPAQAARIVLHKAARFWRPWPYDPYPLWARWVLGAYFGAMLLLAARGAWVLRAQAASWAPVYALIAALTVLHALFFTSLRYRLPLEPFLIALASAGLGSDVKFVQFLPFGKKLNKLNI